jgi:ATP-binding cassette, subfamily B (MDR/TAP), member 1
VSQPLAFILSGVIEGFVAFGVALYYSWKLALVMLALMPLSAIVLYSISRGYQSHVESQNLHLTDASRTANYTINNAALIKAFCTASSESARYALDVGKAAIHSLKQSRVTAAQMGAMGFLVFVMFLLGPSDS